MSKPPIKKVRVTIKGVTHEGTYYVQDKIVHVQSTYGTKAVQVGGLTPEGIARLILTQLVRSA
jgi:hypothetical protein